MERQSEPTWNISFKQHTVFVENEHTADYQMTVALRKMVENGANPDDILACFEERLLPADSVAAQSLAEEVLRFPPKTGYLTISNALQWRLQYSRVIEQAGKVTMLFDKRDCP